jgi:curli biogenesis system outer membrane secretion channel CsgG
MRFREIKSRCCWFILGTLVVLALSSLSVAQAQNPAPARRVRIAILDFDYATVYSNSAAIFGTNVDAGKGIGDLVVTDLVKNGTYSVIERKALDKILAEQNFSNSDRADPNSAAKIGRLLGVDAIVVGSITQFGNDNKSQNVGGAGGALGRFGIGGVGHKSSKAVVGLTARMVSVDTAEILAVAEGKGESQREGVSLLGGGGGWHGWGGGAVDFGSSDFQQTIIGEAIKQATDGLVAELISSSSKIQTRTVSVTGIVAAVDNGSVILNIGSHAGLKVGDQLSVERVTREVKDPATGKVLRRLTSNVGTVKVTDVDEQSAVCSFVNGTDFKEGDIVKTVTQ